MDRLSQFLPSLHILGRQPVVPLYLSQEPVEGLQVVPGGPGQVVERGVQLLLSGQSLVTLLVDVLQTLVEVITVVLAQSTEPLSPRELGTPLLQEINILPCGANTF